MEASRLELDWESNQMNGEGDFTCSVSIPGNISAATVHLPNANHATDVHLPLIGIGTGDAFWEVPGTTDRDDAPVGFGYPPPPHTLNPRHLDRIADGRNSV